MAGVTAREDFMRKLRRWLAVLTAVPLVMAVPAPAGGSPAEPAEVDPVVRYLMAERGIDRTEAQARIRWQDAAAELVDELAVPRSASWFGGLWIGEHDDRIKIGVVLGSGTVAAGETGRLASFHEVSDAVDLVSVRYRAVDLDAGLNWIEERLSQVNADARWPLEAGVIEPDNTLVLGLPPQDQLMTDDAAWLVDEATARFGGMLRVTRYAHRPQAATCAGVYCDLPGRGGVRINYDYDGSYCTLGFLARGRGTGNLYAMTAGHCLVRPSDGAVRQQDWSTWRTNQSQVTIGPGHNHTFGGDHDAAIIRVQDSGFTPSPWVYVRPSWDHGGTHHSSLNTRYVISGDSSPTVGTRVCKTGATSGGTCGRIAATGRTITYAMPYGNVTVNRLVQTTACVQRGDSGGPVFVGARAYGLVSGATLYSDGSVWRDSEGNCRSYYQGIRNAQNELNVDLVTG